MFANLGIFVLVCIFSFASCAKILMLPMTITGSHKKSMLPLADAIAKQGHHVTFWGTFFEPTPIKPANQRVIDVDLITTTTNQLYNEQWVWHNGSDMMDAWNSPEMKPWDELIFHYLSGDICKHGIDQYSKEFHELIRQPWDLVIMDTICNTCGIGISYLSGVPRILVSPSYSLPQTNNHLAIPQPIDSSPANTINYDYTKFWHRLKQFIEWYICDSLNTHIIQLIYAWMLPDILPTAFSWRRFDRQSVYSLNTYPAIVDYPKPLVPDFFSFGDIPCPGASTSELPPEYKHFVEDPESHGTIIAAFGHLVKWNVAPMSDIMEMYNAFKLLPNYRFIWQYDGPELPPLANVKLSHWFPQKDVLYHNKTKAFISHMGLKSIMEGLCAEVPFVGLPVYAEQPLNARLMILRHKTGTLLDKAALRSNEIVESLTEVLENPAYKARIISMRSMMSHKLMDPMEEVAFRVNFSIKHLKFMNIFKIKGRFLNFFVYYNLDIFVIALSIFVFMLAFVRKMLKVMHIIGLSRN